MTIARTKAARAAPNPSPGEGFGYIGIIIEEDIWIIMHKWKRVSFMIFSIEPMMSQVSARSAKAGFRALQPWPWKEAIVRNLKLY